MVTLLLVFLILLLSITAMAIGVLVRKNKQRGELRGSCGGPELNPNCCRNSHKDCEKK